MKTKICSLAIIVIAVLSFTSCEKITGEGPVVTQELDIDYFTGVSNNTSHTVNINYGDALKVTAKGEANIIDRIETFIDNGVWNFELENGNYKNYSLSIEITMPEINYAQMNGSGKIEVSDMLATDVTEELTLKHNGSGRLNVSNMEGYAAIYCKGQGSGSITLSDITMDGSELKLENSGSGNIKISNSTLIAYQLYAKSEGSGEITIKSSDDSFFNLADVNSSGSGSIDIVSAVVSKWSSTQNGSGSVKAHIKDELSVTINGSGSFKYKGSPTILKQEENGSGSVGRL